MRLELIATATFGLEAVVKREIEQLGYRILKTEDGKVTYMGDERAIVRSNLWLRSADRVLLKMAEFEAREFEELFQRTKALDWEQLVPLDGKFTVTGTSVKSRLHSVPACQKIVKKAIVEKLKEFYDVETFPETGAQYTVKATILKDRVTLTIDTSGAGLHKRGYRQADVAAPIKETLAAALVQLSFWKAGRILVDPMLRLRYYTNRGRHDRQEHRAGAQQELCLRRMGADRKGYLEGGEEGGVSGYRL